MKKNTKQKSKSEIFFEAGFTLIEVLMVISIMTLLSSIAMSSYKTTRAAGRDASRKANVNQVSKALEVYNLTQGSYPSGTFYSGWDSGNYPSSDGNCWCRDINDPLQYEFKNALVNSGILKKLPQDPEPREGTQYLFDGMGRGFYYASDGKSYVIGTYLENSEYSPPTSNNSSMCSVAGNFQVSSGSLPNNLCPNRCRDFWGNYYFSTSPVCPVSRR